MFFLYILLVLIIVKKKYFFYKEYTAIVSIMPHLKLHDIVIISEYKSNTLYTIDYTPTIQDNALVVKDLLIGKNVPADIRIRKLNSWDLDKWYQTKTISIDQINDFTLRKHLLKIQNEWNKKEKGMNLYYHNCKHFSQFIINYLLNDSFFKFQTNKIDYLKN